MQRFNVGVEVERTMGCDMVVAVEAETLDEAQAKAYELVKKMSRDTDGRMDLAKAAKRIGDDWEDDGLIDVIGISETDYNDGGYDVDLDLTGEE